MTPAYIVNLALSLRFRQCFVAVCMAATTKRTNVQMLRQTALFRHSLPSIHKTTRNVTIYVAIDDDDLKLMKWKNTLSRFAKVIVAKGEKNRIPMNEVTLAAYNDGAEYIMRTNDDTKFLTYNWVEKGIKELQNMKPPNVGVVAPVCNQGNTHIFTHDMVHRTHIDIFGFYYPPVFKNWYVDDWITKVYEPGRSKRIMDWEVHHFANEGTRYEHSGRDMLKDELQKGKIRLHNYLSISSVKGDIHSNYSLPQEKVAPWTVIVTVSEGFDDMFTNWLFYYSKLNLNTSLLMIAEDTNTTEKYFNVTGIEVWKPHYKDIGQAIPFAYDTVQYKKLMSRRASHILRVLNSKSKIIFTDIDTVWLKDPRPFFTGEFDIWAQLDNVNYYCPGFMAIIKSEEVMRFLRKWNEELLRNPQLNQPIFNKIIHQSNVKHKALPLKEFPSGKLYFTEKKQDGVAIIHNNFIVGKDKKIKRFQDIGYWYLKN